MSNAAMYRCNKEWMSRPDDERYLSLDEMFDHFVGVREQSREIVYPSKLMDVRATEDDDMVVRGIGRDGPDRSLNNWSFDQITQLSGSQIGYLKTLHPKLAPACVTYKLQNVRSIGDVGLLSRDDGDIHTLPAATGPKYGRVWNAGFVDAIRHHVGDGRNGDWTVPGEFGKAVPITKANTTLYASDRDLFVFLADEKTRSRCQIGGMVSRG